MALCKLGEQIERLGTAKNDSAAREARNYAENIEFGVREAAADLRVLYGVDVGRETVRVHRARLCACYTLRESVQPGREAERVPVREARPADLQTPGSVREAVGVAPVASQERLTAVSRWQNAKGDWLESHKYAVDSESTSAYSYDDLSTIVAGYVVDPQEPVAEPDAVGAAFVVPVGDLQLGKPDGGGTAGTVRRFCEKTLAARDRLLQLGGCKTAVLPWLGDCIEGMVSQGGRLQLDIGVSEQLRLYRRLIMFQVETFAPHVKDLIIPVVPGNHDETRRDVATHGTDSWAIEGAASVADALQLNQEAFGHVRFLFPPRGELSFALDVAGTKMGFAHGHQWKPGAAETWLAGQSLGRQAVGDSDVLLSAHLHHMRAQQVGDGRLWLQIPALDGGSDWYRQSKGGDVPGAMLSFVVENGDWRELTIH